MTENSAAHWKDAPDDHDYPAALAFLTLLMPAKRAKAAVRALERAPLIHRKAKDILRASRLELLPTTNPHVHTDLAKITAGKLLSPVLLVAGEWERSIPLTIADGYHRVCASYWTDENTDIPCRLVAMPRKTAATES